MAGELSEERRSVRQDLACTTRQLGCRHSQAISPQCLTVNSTPNYYYFERPLGRQRQPEGYIFYLAWLELPRPPGPGAPARQDPDRSND